MNKNWQRIRRAGPMALLAALVGLLGATAVAAYFVNVAFAASPPPAPSITASPLSPTSSTSATFTYSDSQSGVSFKCSLDSAAYLACGSKSPSSTTYSGLANGTHTFSVEAVVGSAASSAKSYSWVVDTTPPSITLTFPVNSGAYNASAWSTGCSTVGICGSASDAVSTVSSVAISILQQSSGKYWNGSSFSSSAKVFNTAGGTTSWKYALARPTDGTYTLYVQATDALGNTTATANLTTATFLVKTVPPPAPTFGDEMPTNPSTDLSPEFEFNDAAYPNVTFWCDLDSATPMNCTRDTDHDKDTNVEGEWQFANLTPGNHCFYVWVSDQAGNLSTITSDCWTVIGRPTAIAVSSGSPQTTTVHSAFGAPLVAKVTDSSGNPVSGASVTFSAPTSGPSGAFATCSGGNPTANECKITTNSSGLATSSVFTANTLAGGPYTVTATTSGVSGTAHFSLTNNPATASQLAFLSGAVSGPASSSPTLGPITVQLEDSYGNAVKAAANTTLNLSSSSTGGIFASSSGGTATTSVTIPSGSSSTSFFYGDSHAGSPKIKAASGTLTSATQTESIAKATPTLSVTGPGSDSTGTAIARSSISGVLASGSNPSGTLTLKVFGPRPSAPTSCSSGGTTVGAATVTGNGTYHPSSGYSPTSAGNYWWYASYGGDSNNNSAASTCGSGMSETVVSGTVASQLVITTSPVAGSASNSATLGPIVCQVENSSDSPVNVTSNTTVTLSSSSTGGVFASSSGGTSTTTVTINAGSSSTSFYYGDTKAGSPKITASSGLLTPATQTESITAGTANSIMIVSGSPQSAQVASAYASPLVVQVTDTWGNPVGSAGVTFTAPSSGPSGTFSNSTGTISTTTGSNGQATSGTFTADTVAGGPYGVSASTSGPAPVDFVLTNTEGAANKLVFTTEPSANQNVTAGASIPVKVNVEDTYGNTELADNTTTVTLGIGSNPGSGTLTCAGGNTATVSAGVATFSCSINKAANGYTLSATSNPAHGTVISNGFNIVAGTPASITVVSGSSQSATQGQAFVNPLIALVTDAEGNPVSGASVTFTAPSSGASGTFTNSSNTISAPTGSNGQVSEVLTANHTGAVYYSVTASVVPVSTPATFNDFLNGGNFTVNGPTGLAPLLPGNNEALNVVITNPNPESITIGADAITGSVSSIVNGDANGSLPACNISWFSISPGPGSASITIPAGATESLSQLSVPQADWPVLSMTDASANQDNCAGATLNLTFSGTASGS